MRKFLFIINNQNKESHLNTIVHKLLLNNKFPHNHILLKLHKIKSLHNHILHYLLNNQNNRHLFNHIFHKNNHRHHHLNHMLHFLLNNQNNKHLFNHIFYKNNHRPHHLNHLFLKLLHFYQILILDQNILINKLKF
jgi:hypothetical protein